MPPLHLVPHPLKSTPIEAYLLTILFFYTFNISLSILIAKPVTLVVNQNQSISIIKVAIDDTLNQYTFTPSFYP